MKFVFSCLLGISVFLGNARQIDTVDFKTLNAEITFQPDHKAVKGELEYTFSMKENADSIYLDGKKMKAELSDDSPLEAKLHSTDKKIWLVHNFKAKTDYTVKFTYETQNPEKALYFIGWDNKGSNQIWSQGEGKHNSYWLPSIDDKNDKIVFNMTYKVPEDYTAIGNGSLKSHKNADGQEVWHYTMENPMSSYLVAVAVGKYDKKSLNSTNGTPLELYYEPKDSGNIEPTYRYSKEIFDFLEDEIGVDYPWENYKQIPVRDFLYAGMENTTATIFAESFFTDSIGFIDRNYVNVNAHELAHQWFGDLVTEQSSEDHWLQEGFATYYALLAEKKVFGEKDFYYKLYKNAEDLKEQSDNGEGQALTNPEANSLTFYQKGAWALHILREKIGNEAFKTGIRNYLEKHKFETVTTDDFITEMEKSSGEDLSGFVDKWLNQSAFQAKEALESLRESSFINKFLELAALQQTDFRDKADQLENALKFPINKFLGQEAVNQLPADHPSEKQGQLYKKAFKSNTILVRQAIASSLTTVPDELKEKYESLLDDDSYLTQETALLNLWNSFPKDQKKYLDKLKNTQGFYDKNVRMLWLTLSLVTDDYHPENNDDYFNELSGYTSPRYDYSIRKNAFGHLYQINTFSNENYQDLLEATTHHNWRFRKFARALLDKLLNEENHRGKLKELKPHLSKKERKNLDKAMHK